MDENEKSTLSVETIIEKMLVDVGPRRACLGLAFDRGLRKEKEKKKRQGGTKLEKWILTEMLVKLLKLRDDGFLDDVEGEHDYQYPKFRFPITIDPDIERDLEADKIPAGFNLKFEDASKDKKVKAIKPLTEDAIVKPGEKDNEWTIEDENKEYIIRKMGCQLNIHSGGKERCDLWWRMKENEHWLEVKTFVIINDKRDVDERNIPVDLKKRLSLRQDSSDIFHHLSIVFLESSCANTLKERLDCKYGAMSCVTECNVPLEKNKQLLFLLYS